jgi:DNA repair exonuclease SbcCD ATPase subunit
MNAILKTLKLSYFKGIKSLTVNFGDTENTVSGKNEAGKTTLFDALWFLFFGKDSTGRADFSIKTYDEYNVVIPKVDHEVTGIFEIDGATREFKRVYKELWAKATDTLKGHTTEYWIDGYPVATEREFKQTIAELFKEELFKLLTNPLFFNSLKPLERREALIKLCPEISDAEIFASLDPKSKKSPQIQELEKLLTQGKTLQQIKLKAAADKKALKDEKEGMPIRIDEAERNKPEAFDQAELDSQIESKKKEISLIEKAIEAGKNKAESTNKGLEIWQTELFSLKRELKDLEFKAQTALDEWKREAGKEGAKLQSKLNEKEQDKRDLDFRLENKKQVLKGYTDKVSTFNSLIEKEEKERADLVTKWKAENATQFEFNGHTCVSCDRPYEGGCDFHWKDTF